jgi:hypothetical protein
VESGGYHKDNMSKTHDSLHIHQVLNELTHGRRFIFFIESYQRPKHKLFEFVRARIMEEYGLTCVRAKEVKSGGHDLLAKIHQLIKDAAVVIAEVSDPIPGQPSPNVFYEVGYAVGVGKRPLLLLESSSKAHTDVRGLEFIEYVWPEKPGKLGKELSEHLRPLIDADMPVLRDMLEGEGGGRSFIVASPKRMSESVNKIKGAPTIKTFGDRLGILGLIRAFGSFSGEAAPIEFISARHPALELLLQEANLYFIGSPKVNHPAGELLCDLQDEKWPRWHFQPTQNLPGNGPDEKDQPLVLCREDSEGVAMLHGKSETPREGTLHLIWTEDYGLIVRAPHPMSEKRIVLLMAGAHSLGTGAACLAATRSNLIKQVRKMLWEKTGEDILNKKECLFWVLVKGTVKADEYLLGEEDVTIVDAGGFRPK